MTRLVLGPVLRHVGTDDATVWVETAGAGTVEVVTAGPRGRSATFCVAGHHYALVCVEGMRPGTTYPYQVLIDDEPVWPEPRCRLPPSRIRTVDPDTAFRLVFGSCRYATSHAVRDDDHYDFDALDAFAIRMTQTDEDRWPDALLLVGDQVYADETSPETKRYIAERRDTSRPPYDQVADFEEYTRLYLESWTDPEVRWLMASIPSSMIFDDHDVRDDWNTSRLWREEMARTSWWRERITGALMSYWVYQHLGNLSPSRLASDEVYRRVCAADDGAAILREFAQAADHEADGAKGAQWSYRRDFGRVRLLVIDSRCGRVLDGRRSIVSEAEFAWIERQVEGEYDHLLVGTSLPWLLPRALHDIESWNEAVCAGSRGRLLAAGGEKLRRAADLEHWAAFRDSFDRLARLLARVGRGEHGGAAAPATICVLSGDVHHAYIARADLGPEVGAPIYQLTCSPLHNYVPAVMHWVFRVAWSAAAERTTRLLLGAFSTVPKPPLSWRRLSGPFFGNEIATLTLAGRAARLLLEKAGAGHRGEPFLDPVAAIALAWPSRDSPSPSSAVSGRGPGRAG
ncbi:MAG: alkaline phosphatase [Pseudonocardiales bacterium]|nr:MAG: alkaline phosphatase [Pseudonocardiales bacterium]